MAKTTNHPNTLIRWRMRVRGIVQGVGFRPFVYRLARDRGVTGWVCNTGDGVVIEAEGVEDRLRRFAEGVRSEAPPLARVSDLEIESLTPAGYAGFEIRHSEQSAGARTTVPPDIATCHDCLADISTPGNRRFGYPFTNCTNCGPRFTIIREIPYDRPFTTMSDFAMCPDCQAEYDDPGDRRFHAQPNACPVCGPHLILDGERCPDDADAIAAVAEMLMQGRIVAVKGLGGFHLACDARNSEALQTLRDRKGRVGKPFALMCRDLDEARRICVIDAASEALLLSPERPIVLMPAREGSGISPLVAPGVKSLGVMLPYTPLHHLLLAQSPPSLVMTSGNISEEPIAYRDEEAADRLGHLADHILAHDRPIHAACDDSVLRAFDSQPMAIRRARGYVPRPIELDLEMPQILACGGDLKSAFCVTKGRLAWLSQHLGELENAPTLEHYRHILDHFLEFFDVRPEIIAHDLHPDYHSTALAAEIEGCEKIAVQHHHAHIASCMAENRLDGQVIGVAFDGTGYGLDGRIWGGEFFIGGFDGFRRAAHLAYVPMPGGEAAIRRPRRMALAYVLQAFGDWAEPPKGMSDSEALAVKTQIERGLNSPLTSSMGRLFDAVSAMLGVCSEVTYEGQAAIELEGMAAGMTEEAYGYDLLDGGSDVLRIDPRPAIRSIVEDSRRGRPVEEMSSVFHSTVAQVIVDVCRRLRDESGLERVCLSGGVFQNVLLLEMAVRRLEEAGFGFFIQRLVPCNDGGISLGQAVIAARMSGRRQ